MSSPFVFPTGSGAQALHGMGVQSRRESRENRASVLASILPLIPRISTRTVQYGQVSTAIPNLWTSQELEVPEYGDEGKSIVFVSMDGTSLGSEFILTWQILRNGVTLAECRTQDLWDGLASTDPHQYGMWAGPADPGDKFSIRCGLGNGDQGMSGSSKDVTFSLTIIHYRQQAGSQDSKEAVDG